MAVVRTVLGDVPADQIGAVLFHEHVLFDIVPPGAKGDRDAAINPADRWQIDYRANAFPANAHQQDPDIASEEMRHLSADGGSLVVDQSVAGLARDAAGLAHVARAAGVHVVAAAGSYTAPYLSTSIVEMDVDALFRRFKNEVTEGLDGTPVRAGLIGEMGCSWPMEPVERRALQAAARAAEATGAALSVHPGRDAQACEEILDLVEAEGLDPRPVGMRAIHVEWDFFGIEQSHYWMGEVDLPMDRDRLRLIAGFADAGYADQILISQDICTKTRLRRWGGHGYGHILRNVVPLMRRFGFEPTLIETLIRDTPVRLLTLKEPTA